MLRQRRWLGFTIFALVLIVVCVVLARWQWGRYLERRAENDRLDEALAAPATPVADLVDPVAPGSPPVPLPRDLEWRTATAVGVFDAAHEVAVRRRPLDGRNGFWIVTPLVTDTGVILVNRGWVVAGRDALTTPAVPPPPAGVVSVAGRLRAGESSDRVNPPPGQAWAIDPQVLVPPGAGPRYDAYLELRDSQPDSAAGLTTLADPGHRGWNNLVYAVQWLVFAAVAVFGWWRLLAAEAQRSGAARSG